MNKTQIYMLTKSEFLEKKAQKESIAYENLMNAKKDTKFLDLYHKERTLRFDIAKNKINKIPTKMLEEQLEDVVELKIQRLHELKINEKDLSPIYDCVKCEDSGFLKNGKRCDCFNKKLKEKLISESSKNLSTLPTFDLYNEKIAKNPEHQNQLLKLKKFMQSWVDNTSDDKQHLITICGDTGVGKSYLTECTATYALKKGYLVSLITAFSMNNIFLKYISSKNEEKIATFDSLMDPDLLIIDDLGAEPVINNVTIEYLYLILSERLQNKKSTIITTNLDPNIIRDRYGERIFSRIFNKRESFNAKITGSDLRINK